MMGKVKLSWLEHSIKVWIAAIILLSGFTMAHAQVSTLAFSIASLEQSKIDGSKIKPITRNIPKRLHYLVPEGTHSPFASSSPYIVGGSNAARGEFPEFTQVLVDGQDGFVYAVCGASLISADKVLTAGHCSLESTNLYYVVPNFYSFNDNLTSANVFTLSSKVTHPNYNNTTLDYDVAIFTLSRNTSGTKAVMYGENNQLVGQQSTVIGTGLLSTDSGAFPSVLRKVSTPIVSNSACSGLYLSPITARMICSGYSNSGLGACNGDSGGPLWVTIDNQRTQVGVVSFGYARCETPGAYGGYARISALTSFIKTFAPQARFSGKPIVITPIYQLLLD